MTCDNLCTAAKCEELERRISAIEQNLALLTASFQAHTSQDIPTAHEYKPVVNVETYTANEVLIIDVVVDDSSDSAAVALPVAESIESNIKIDGSYSADVLTLTVADGESFDTAQISIPLPEIPELPEHVESNLRIDGSYSADVLTLTVADGESFDTAQISIPLPEIPELPELPEPVKSNLKIDGSFRSDVLTLTVADGESFDTAQISIPLPELSKHVESNLKIDGSYSADVLTLTIADGESFDTTQIQIELSEEMNCDDLTDELRNLQNILVAEIEESENNLFNKVDGIKNELLNDLLDIKNDVDDVIDAVTVDISGNMDSQLICTFPVTDDEKPIPAYAFSESTLTNYSGVGLAGIHETLKLISNNITTIHSDVCKAIDPINSISVDDLYKFCELEALVDRSQYFDDNGDPKTNNSQEEYDAAVEAALSQLLAESKYGALIANASDGKLIEAPSSWTTPILADFALIQGKINNSAICKLDEQEPTDVVAIVASDKVLDKHQGKTLVLHLVTGANYPKRLNGSSYWTVQIPNARSEYSWNDDFLSLRWNRGNLYCEQYFEGIRDPVSGWFLDKDAANSWFNSVNKLTTATERNRKYHEQKTPARLIAANTVRPYRAFITSINSSGRAVCEVKYVPKLE